MGACLAAIGFTLAVWWLSTGAIMLLAWRDDRAQTRNFAVATTIALIALGVLHAIRDITSAAGAYAAFSCAIVAWGWIEFTFLTGRVTGSRRIAAPPGARGWRAARFAFRAIDHHEYALVAVAAGIALATWGGSNQVGLATFLLLWLMRLSAKLNLFLGVKNHTEAFLPIRLRYLQTYFRTRSMNQLFPVSVTVGSIIAWGFFSTALSEGVSPYETATYALLGALTALAVLEHWFMVLPLPATALWNWSMPASRAESPRRV